MDKIVPFQINDILVLDEEFLQFLTISNKGIVNNWEIKKGYDKTDLALNVISSYESILGQG